MHYKRHLFLLSLFLLAISSGIFFYKMHTLHLPLSNQGTSTVWTVEARLQFEGNKKPAKVTLVIPSEQPHFARLDEQFVAPHYGASIAKAGDNRVALLSTRRAAGKQLIYYRVQFYVDDAYTAAPVLGSVPPLRREVLEGAKATAAESLINEVREKSADSFSFAAGLVAELLDAENDNAAIVLDRNFSTSNIARVTQALLWGSDARIGPNIMSRLVHGFRLTRDVAARKNIPLETYLAVFDNAKKTWHYINPENGALGLPNDFLVWEYGLNELVQIEGGVSPNLVFSFTQQLQPTLNIAQEAAIQSKSFFIDFSLFTLPLQTQQLYQILIMIPLGALVVLLLRSFIGVPTFGTFMPVLIALAFRETDLISGVVLFILIVSIGLVLRFYLEHLKLLLIPRLSVVLSGVILIMMVLSVVSHKLGFDYGLSIALFPMVIITMTIERMSIVWEERSPWEALKQGAGSLLCAALAYGLMTNAALSHILFVFPELILWIVVLMLWLGHYHGYRLSEWFRFRDLISKDLS